MHEKYRESGLNLDVPNLHLLVESALRALPMIGDLRSALTNRYEAMHQINKQRISTVSFTTGSNPENFAIREAINDEAIQFVLDGGRWGPGLEFVASRAMRSRITSTLEYKVYCFSFLY